MLGIESDYGGKLSLSIQLSEIDEGSVRIFRILLECTLVLKKQLRVLLIDFLVIQGEVSYVLRSHEHLLVTSKP